MATKEGGEMPFDPLMSWSRIDGNHVGSSL
jgi:hypothetical protein